MASSNASSCLAWLVMVALVVLAAFSTVRMSCAAPLYASLKPFSACQSARIVSLRGLSCEQNLVGVCGGLTDPLPLTANAFGECGQRAVELGGVDLVQHGDHVLEHRVDLGADIARLEHLTGCQPLRAGVVRIHQIDEFRAEHRGGADLRFDVRRDVLDLVGVDLQFQGRRVLRPRHRSMAATRPTWTPRSLTLALVSITKPARSEVSVTGTSDSQGARE